MTRQEMIDFLIDNDLSDWEDSTQRDEYLADILRNGFVGYEYYDYQQLVEEVNNRK